MDIARKLTEKCKESLRSNGIDVVVTAADGEFNQLMVRGRNNQPLTQNQLMKDVWRDACKLSKVQILDLFLKKCRPGCPVRENIQGKNVISIQTDDCQLQRISTPTKGWTPPKGLLKGSVADEEKEMTIEEHGSLICDGYENSEILPDIQALIDDEERETANQNKTGVDETTEEMPEPETKEIINISDIHNLWIKVNNNKQESVGPEDISRHLQSADNLKKLTVKEHIAVTKYVNDQQKGSSKNMKTSNVKKHE